MPRTATKAGTAKALSPEEVARSYFQAVADRDLEAIRSHWHPDGVDDFVAIRPFRGPDEVAGLFRELFAAMPDIETVVERVTADDHGATVQWRSSGTFTGGPFQGVDPTGSRIELRGVDCLEVDDGKIVKNTVYYDGAAFARAVGMLPPKDSGLEKAMFSAFNGATKLRTALRERRER